LLSLTIVLALALLVSGCGLETNGLQRSRADGSASLDAGRTGDGAAGIDAGDRVPLTDAGTGSPADAASPPPPRDAGGAPPPPPPPPPEPDAGLLACLWVEGDWQISGECTGGETYECALTQTGCFVDGACGTFTFRGTATRTGLTFDAFFGRCTVSGSASSGSGSCTNTFGSCSLSATRSGP